MNALSPWRSLARSRALTILLTLALAIVAAIPLLALWAAFGPKPVKAAPDFTLTDQDGRLLTLSSLRGHPVVIFFGYTHCPDACPTTLAHLARALRAKGAPADDQVLFVTVDPERDSPANLKTYVHLFDPHFDGLTGSEAQLDPVYAAYDTWRQAVPVVHGNDDYFMAHGTTIYYIGRDGALKGYGHWDDALATMTHDLEAFQ